MFLWYNKNMNSLPIRKLMWIRIITPVIIFFALISSLVAGFFVVYIRTPVNGLSMSPTLNTMYEQTGKRDMVYINRFNKGKVGDIVVLDLRSHPTFGDYAIKRLVAVEGDVVNICLDTTTSTYNLIVNGEIIESKPHQVFELNTYSSFNQYIKNHKSDSSRISVKDNQVEGVIIKKGEIFVLGDNWNVSKDSSLVGPISQKSIVGRVDMVIKPNKNELLTILKRIF